MLKIFDALLPYFGGKRKLCPIIFRHISKHLPREQWYGKVFVDAFLGSGAVSRKYARIDGHIPWDAVEDRVRSVYNGEGRSDKNDFTKEQADDFLEGYRRHLLQGQDKFIEVWIEKDALARIFARLTYINTAFRPLCVEDFRLLPSSMILKKGSYPMLKRAGSL